MIPESINYIGERQKQASLTFKIYFDSNRIVNRIDNIEAVKQAVFLMLLTERDYSEIYEGYGLKVSDLIGQDIGLVTSEFKRRIIECLKEDDRIVEVDTFEFIEDKEGLLVTFRVSSIYGDFPSKVVHMI